jgi:N-acetylglucosaminyl-diphospho-decaprenol L-rhamnosyltransferase
VSAGVPAAGLPRLSAIVVSYNTRDDLLRCLAALHAPGEPSMDVIVVDNASHDGSADAVGAHFPAVRVVANAENLGFSKANNIGLRAASGEYALLVNSDCEVRPGAVATLLRLIDARPDVAMAGPRHVGSDGSPQVSFGPNLTLLAEWRQGRLVRGVKAGHADAQREAAALGARESEPDWLSASCVLARRSALEAVGGFDEGFFLYEEDVDLCLRLRRAGWRVVFTPAAEVVHHLGRSMDTAPARARLEYHRSHLRFYSKHNPVAQRLALRAFLAAKGASAWLTAGSGDAGARRRGEARDLLRLAVFG